MKPRTKTDLRQGRVVKRPPERTETTPAEQAMLLDEPPAPPTPKPPLPPRPHV